MSRMTPSSKTPVGNQQCPPSMTSRTGGSWYTSFMLESWNLSHWKIIIYHNDILCQGWPNPSRLQSKIFNVLQVWLQGWRVCDTLLIMQEPNHLGAPIDKDQGTPFILVERLGWIILWLRLRLKYIMPIHKVEDDAGKGLKAHSSGLKAWQTPQRS